MKTEIIKVGSEFRQALMAYGFIETRIDEIVRAVSEREGLLSEIENLKEINLRYYRKEKKDVQLIKEHEDTIVKSVQMFAKLKNSHEALLEATKELRIIAEAIVKGKKCLDLDEVFLRADKAIALGENK